LLVPATVNEIEEALGALKCAKLFDGFRGQPAANRQAVVKAVLAIQDYVIANADKITEVEINPLICTPQTAIAADALITREE